MFKSVAVAILAFGAIGAASPASTNVYTDDLSRCLVEKTSKADQTFLIQWVFAAISAGPDVKTLSTVTPAQRTNYSLGVGKLMTRLLTVDCRAETVKAVKYDGPNSIQVAFELLGRVAMQGMMADPAVTAELAKLEKGADMNALGAVMAEAGVKPPAGTDPK